MNYQKNILKDGEGGALKMQYGMSSLLRNTGSQSFDHHICTYD